MQSFRIGLVSDRQRRALGGLSGGGLPRRLIAFLLAAAAAAASAAAVGLMRATVGEVGLAVVAGTAEAAGKLLGVFSITA